MDTNNVMLYLSLLVVCSNFLIPEGAAFLVEIPITSTRPLSSPLLPPPPHQRQQQHPSNIIEVPRMSVNEFAIYWRKLHHDWYQQQQQNSEQETRSYDHQLLTPILVTDVLSSQQCEFICSQFIETAQNDTSIFVELQRRRRMKRKGHVRSNDRRSSTKLRPPTSTSDLLSYNVSLLQGIDTIMTQSNHNDAFWCFQEGLLEDYSVFQPIYELLQSTRQFLLEGCSSINDDSSNSKFKNWFDYFPKWAQSTDCVILSGIGSTSTLHRDPFEWTGTSVCVEGTKIWRFIEPNPNVHTIDAMMQSYRLPSVAWSGNITISAGWQSDFSLYRNVHPNVDRRSVEERSTTPLRDEKYSEILKLAQSLDDLQPDNALLELNWTTWTAVQQEGDFLIIPSHYWHQTYTIFEPTVTISSQHCSDLDLYRVLNHILTTTNQTQNFNVEDLMVQLKNDDHPKERIQQFFKHLESTLS